MSAEPNRILVITPTLGQSAFLDKTVASVLAQPLDVQHVISAPAARREDLQRRFPRARVVEDAGAAAGIYGAINNALAQAGAGWDWFTYINDDDALLPGFGEVAARHLRSAAPEAVVYGDVELIDENDCVLSRVTTERDPAWIPALLQQGISPLMQQGMLLRRDTMLRLRGFDTGYRLCADLDLWLRAYVSGAGFRHYPVRVAQFRLRRGQLSGNTAVTQREQGAIIARHLPTTVSPLRKTYARWRYRLCNLPRYLARVRAGHGLQTSYELLETGGSRR